MGMLIAGLVLFLGAHGVRIYADGWRTRTIGRIGEGPWKIAYSLTSLAGLVLIGWGFGPARAHPVVLYTPPTALRHLNALFTLLAFVLVTAAYVPGNHFKSALGHPMLAGVKTWALGHLLAAGMLHDVLLFGGFLVWAIAGFAAARRRDRRAGVVYARGTVGGDIATVLIGAVAWAAFAFWLHVRLIGVAPFG